MSKYTFKQIIEFFLKDRENEKTGAAYKKKIYSFYEYLFDYKNARDSNYNNILMTLTIDEFIDSIRVYAQNNHVRYKSSTDLYLSTVKSFYSYLSSNGICSNQFFDNKLYVNIVKDKYEKLVKQLKLNPVEQVMPLNEEQAKMIVDACNRYLDEFNFENIFEGKRNGAFSRYISAILCKLVLCFGVSNKTIRNLVLEDYERDNGRIRINGYSVRLPDKMRKNMDVYVEYRSRIINAEDNPHLFIDFTNSQREYLDNTKMYFILFELIGSNCATSLAKYAIIHLIKQGLPAYLIQEFTGYKSDIYNHCQEIINEEKSVMSKGDRCKLLDNSLNMAKLFDEM